MKLKQLFFALVAMLSCFVLSANAQNVAKIGDTEYAKLSAAISAATAGQTITFIGDVNENVTVGKNLTIDGADFNYTGTLTANDNLTVTVQNVNFVNAGFTKVKGTKGTYTIKDCTFDGANKAYGYAVTTKGARTLTIENCTVKDYSYGFLYNTSSLTYHSVKNVTVENCNYGVRMASTGTTNLVNFVTSNVMYPVEIQANAARTVNMTDCSIYEVPNGGASLSCWGGTSTVEFNFKGTNVFDAELPGDANFVYNDKETNVTIVEPAVAKIGNVRYTTLAKAVAAAKAGNTITLVRDVKENVTVSLGITIDGNGKTLTGKITSDKNNTVTIKNVKFNGNNGAVDYAVRNDNGSIVIENCTASGYVNGLLYANKSNNNVTVKNSTISDCNGFGIHLVSFNNAYLNGVAFNNVKNGVVVQNAGVRNVTFTDCTMENVETPVYVWEKGTGKVNVKFNGVNDFGAKFKLGKYGNANGAVLGGTKVYPSLNEAIAASEEVTLIANTTGAGAVIDKDLVFDLYGSTYSFTEGVGSTGTESNGLQILKGNDVVVKNGTLNVAAAAASKFYTIIQNYADLTVEDMNLDGTNLDKWSLTDGDSYVLSNNSGNVVVKGNTNITANNDGEKAFAFDACDKSANGYALPVVTVETTGKIAGNIENSATIVITNGTYTIDVTEWCADGYISLPNEDGETYSVSYDPAYGKAAKLGDKYYETFEEAYDLAEDGDEILLLHTIVISDSRSLDKNVTVKAEFDDFAFRVQDGATVDFAGISVESNDYCLVLGASDGSSAGNANISAGTFNGETTAVSVTKGLLNITGGEFQVEPYQGNYNYTINCVDANYKNETAKVAISGGKFYNFNPADNAAEGEGTNFVAPGYVTGADAKGWWTVAAPVAVIGETGYISINHAFAAAEDGDTVQMVADVELGFADAVLNNASQKVLANVAGDKNITFDMNGKKISVEHRSTVAAERIFAVICVENGAGLTVTGEGSIDITTGITDANTMPKVAYMFWKRGTTGYLVIENGNFHMDNSEDSMVYTNGDQIVTVKGGTFTLDAVRLRGKEKNFFPWIFNTDGRNTKSIVVTGGTYNYDIRDQFYKEEVLIPVEVVVLVNEDGTCTVMGAAAHIGDIYYSTFAKAYEKAVEGDVIELIRTAVISEDMLLNKNVTVKAEFDDVAIRVQDGATVDFAGTSVESDDYCVILGSSDKATAGYVNISAGHFYGETTAVSVTTGLLNITGGEFKVAPYQETIYNYTINCYDANYKSGDAVVAITGGKFYNFNPADNAAEGVGTNFIPEEVRDVYASGVDAEGWWTVAEGVAEVDGKIYISLVDAVAAAKAGSRVTMLQDAAGAGISINKDLTIDFNENTYTLNGGAVGSSNTKSNGFHVLAGNDVTLMNGTLEVAEAAKGEFYMLIQNYANLTVENMNLDGTNLDKYSATDGDSYVLSNNCGTVNVIASTITANNDGELAYAFDVCKYANYEAPEVTVDAESAIYGNVEVSATLNMKGTLNGNILINGLEGIVYTAEDKTVTTNVADYKVVYADGAYKVIAKDYVAQVGEAKFETLAEAYAAGNVINILKDVTGPGLVIEKNLTINFNGYKYSFNEAVGTARKYNGLEVKNGYVVTLENGTLNVAPEAADKFYTIIQNDGTLTLNSMNLDGTYLDIWADGGDSYVLYATNGSVTVNGESNITANDNGDKAYAFSSCAVWSGSKYTSPMVTIKNAGRITGKVEKVGTTSQIVIHEGTYDMNVSQWCDAGLTSIKQDNGTWVVASTVARVENPDGSVYGFETLGEAIAAAEAGAVVTLMKDVTLTDMIQVEKPMTINLGKDSNNNKTVTATCKKAFEIYADVTFQYGKIVAVNRCVDTRTNVKLTLNDVDLVADNYTAEYENPQPLTIGGSDDGTVVTLSYVNISARDGYGIIAFVKTTLNASHTKVNGYNALYAKPGSEGSEFNFTSNSTLTGDCRSNDVDGNSFSVIAIQENGVKVYVDYNSTVNAYGEYMDAISIGYDPDPIKTGNVVKLYGTINGNILDVENPDENTVTIRSQYADRLLAEGYSYKKESSSYITAKSVASVSELVINDTDEAYVQNEPLLHVDKLTYNRTFETSNIDKWQAFYVPFEVPVSMLNELGYEVAYYNNFKEDIVDFDIQGKMSAEIVKIRSGVLKANFPYLIVPTENAELEMSLKFEDVELYSSTDPKTQNTIECTSAIKTFTFAGTLKKATRAQLTGDASGNTACYALKSGNLDTMSPTATLGAFRIFLVITNKDGSVFIPSEAQKSIGIYVVGEENEDGTTTIYDVPVEAEVEGLTFDLQGRRVLETEEGIYIKDGKKVLVK